MAGWLQAQVAGAQLLPPLPQVPCLLAILLGPLEPGFEKQQLGQLLLPLLLQQLAPGFSPVLQLHQTQLPFSRQLLLQQLHVQLLLLVLLGWQLQLQQWLPGWQVFWLALSSWWCHFPRGDLPCCMVAWSASLSSRQLATLLVSLPFFKAAAVPFSRQLLCLFQGSCCAFFKAVVETLFHLPLFKGVRIVIATQNLVVEPRWALNQKAAVTHTSLAMPCPEHVTTLARLQHKTTEGTRTGRIKGTAEDQWKTQGKHRKGNITNNKHKRKT